MKKENVYGKEKLKTIRLLVFDLDGTLAEIGRGITRETIEILRRLEEQGLTIAICSGKPVYYLVGMMRQVGLKKPVLLGENGAVMQIGVSLPPENHFVLPYTEEARQSISDLKERLRRRFPDLWYQPNQVGLTPFFRSEQERVQIKQCLDECCLKEVEVYEHCDSFDIIPRGISKYTGMEALGKYLEIGAEETLAVGDGENDYPMFAYAGFSIGIHLKKTEMVDKNAETIEEALRDIQELLA